MNYCMSEFFYNMCALGRKLQIIPSLCHWMDGVNNNAPRHLDHKSSLCSYSSQMLLNWYSPLVHSDVRRYSQDLDKFSIIKKTTQSPEGSDQMEHLNQSSSTCKSDSWVKNIIICLEKFLWALKWTYYKQFGALMNCNEIYSSFQDFAPYFFCP